MNTVILLIVVMLLLVLASVLSVAFVALLVMGSAWLAGGEAKEPEANECVNNLEVNDYEKLGN